jgi:hypothetical protein
VQGARDEQRLLRQVAARQEQELDGFTGGGELPAIQTAHSEELATLKLKMKKLQESNKQLSGQVKEKDAAVLRYREQNKELKRVGREQGLADKAQLKEEVDDLRLHLDAREGELKDLVRRQEILDKSQRRQMGAEMRKRSFMLR